MSFLNKDKIRWIWVSCGCALFIFLYTIFYTFSQRKYLELFVKYYQENYFLGGILNLLDTEKINSILLITLLNVLLIGVVILVAVIFRKPFGRVEGAFVSINRRYFLAAVVFFSFINLLCVFKCNKMAFPMGGDDAAYLFQAQLLSSGRLWAPSHPLKEFFQTDYIINHNGKTYAEYTLGTSFFLALGILVGAPWIINPLLCALSLIFLYFIAVRLFDESIARYGVILISISIFVIGVCTSYNSHAASLFFITGFLFFFIKTLDEEAWFYPVISGLFWGIAVNTRQLTAFSFALPFWIWGIHHLIREKKRILQPASLFIAGSILPIMGLMVVNTLQNGGPFIFGHTIYNGPDKNTYGFGGEYSLAYAVGSYFFRMHNILIDLLSRRLSPAILLILMMFSCTGKGKNRLLIWLAMFTVALAYLPVVSNLWQARYYLIPSILMIFLIVFGIRRLGVYMESCVPGLKPDSLILIFVIICFGFYFSIFSLAPTGMVFRCMMPYRVVKEAGLHKAIVFLKKVNHFYPSWFCRNSPDYDDNVLYAIDMGDKNQKLMDYYPDRTYYRFNVRYLSNIGDRNRPVYHRLAVSTDKSPYIVWEQ